MLKLSKRIRKKRRKRDDAKLIFDKKKKKKGGKTGILVKRPFPARPKKLPLYRNIVLKF